MDDPTNSAAKHDSLASTIAGDVKAIDPEEVLFSGYLTKEGGSWRSWKRRFFVLSISGALNYYEDDSKRKPKGSLDCSGKFALRPLSDLGELHFEIDTEVMSTKADRTLRVFADSRDDLSKWSQAFNFLLNHADRSIRRSSTSLSEGQAIYMAGYLTKEGTGWKSWKRRFFTLKKNGEMAYYEDESLSKLKGFLNCREAEVNPMPDLGPFNFEIVSDIFGEGTGRSLKLQTEDEIQMERWMKVVRVVSCMYGDKDEDVDSK